MTIKTASFMILTGILAICTCQGLSGNTVGGNEDSAQQLFWLANALNDHGFGVEEAAAAANIAPAHVRKLLKRAAIPDTALWHDRNVLKLLPYPGGRHPRIGFLEGAIDPLRGTKVSLFTPWNESSYIVIDVPEAIFSNLGLIWLAHTHIPTVWDDQDIEVERFEWDRRDDGSLRFQCRLPNKIRFGTLVRPTDDGAEMKMWLCNGTDTVLTGLRTQVCIMLKGAEGFRAQTNENKSFQEPVGIARHSLRDRYILTAWRPCHVVWANPPCPCLHSDPIFPDCPPGKTVYCHGDVVFYEGKEIDRAVSRVEARIGTLRSWYGGEVPQRKMPFPKDKAYHNGKPSNDPRTTDTRSGP